MTQPESSAQVIHRIKPRWLRQELVRQTLTAIANGRPRLAVQARVFCLHCAYSVPLERDGPDTMGSHLGTHPGAGAVDGVDFATGCRYAPWAEGTRRGRPRTLPALRTRRQAQPHRFRRGNAP